MTKRKTRDSLGLVEIPSDKLWGGVSQRSLNNFRIGNHIMPLEIIYALAEIKLSAAKVNFEEKLIDNNKLSLIEKVIDEIISGKLDEHFPLSVWQTGSGTHTNMNLNEVIANRAEQLETGKISGEYKVLHPNNDVNKSQSSNDVFPSAIHISLLKLIDDKLLPALNELKAEFENKSEEFYKHIKTGRTHLMDAVPVRLGQEFSAYAEMISKGIADINNVRREMQYLPLGGTAVGTGLNTPPAFDKKICKKLSEISGKSFIPAVNKFESMSSKNTLLRFQNALSVISSDLIKITNDIRLMASGPRTGLHELELPAMEPGSSIMPGKVNPTQIEALQMACVRIISHSEGSTIANMNGNFQLNTYMPLLAANSLESLHLLSDVAISFAKNNLKGIKAVKSQLDKNLRESLMLVTSLAPEIGYDKAAETAHLAHQDGISLKEAVLKLGYISEDRFDELTDAEKMV